MAKSIFSPCEGAIAKVDLCSDGAGSGGGGTFNVTVNGAQLGFPTSGFILEMQGNYQFLHALDNFIYYYNFGDRVGELTVSGFGFMGPGCNEYSGPMARRGDVCGMYDLYLQNRQSKLKKAIPIGTDKCGIFWGFLTGMRLEISSGAAGMPIGQWSLRFHVIPPRD